MDSNPTFAHAELQDRLFARTFRHPELGTLAQWVPTQWLIDMANPSPSETASIDNNQSDRRVDMKTLFANMLEEGMSMPFVVGVGRVNRRARLESGNHRIRIFQKMGVQMVPAVALVGPHSITRAGNGLHEGIEVQLSLPPAQETLLGSTHHRISDVIVRAPVQMGSPGFAMAVQTVDA